MNDRTERTELKAKKNQAGETDTADPVHTVREGAVAASIWLRQSPSGFPYYDFSLSRSWKSVSSGRTGYSKNFFGRIRAELISVIEGATRWIVDHETSLPKEDQEEAFAA